MADDKLEMVDAHNVRYAGRMISRTDSEEATRLGLSKERLEKYERDIEDLGVTQLIRNDRSVEFRVDQGSILNGDSYKGYEYYSGPPEHVRPSLDSYRKSEQDRDSSGGYYVSRPISDHWYLYLFING